MSDVRCKSCRFFTQAQVMGLCRRFPETQNKHEMDWCGEHQLIAYEPVPEPVHQPAAKKRGRPKNGH